MPIVPTIVFVRHGETDWNVAERLQGQQDIPLNDRGRAQAKRNGLVAAAIPAIESYDFVSSPLIRSRETMEIARAAMGLDAAAYDLDDRLREIAFGEWEGFTTAELRGQNAELLAAREKDKWGFLPPGGESYRILSDRVEAWLAEVKRPVFVVAHGGVGRVLRRYLLDLDPQEAVAGSFPQDKVLLFGDGTAEWL